MFTNANIFHHHLMHQSYKFHMYTKTNTTQTNSYQSWLGNDSKYAAGHTLSFILLMNLLFK